MYENVAIARTPRVAWNRRALASPLRYLGYRKISVKVKIATLVAASEYVRLTLEPARSSGMTSSLRRIWRPPDGG
jgi:hypothetical protein